MLSRIQGFFFCIAASVADVAVTTSTGSKTDKCVTVYKTDKFVYKFLQFEKIGSFAKYILAGKITLDNTDKDQSDLLNDFIDFRKRTKPKDLEKKQLKRDTIENINALYEGRKICY